MRASPREERLRRRTSGMPRGSRPGLYIESSARHRSEPSRESKHRNIDCSNALCQLPRLTHYSDPVVSPLACRIPSSLSYPACIQARCPWYHQPHLEPVFGICTDCCGRRGDVECPLDTPILCPVGVARQRGDRHKIGSTGRVWRAEVEARPGRVGTVRYGAINCRGPRRKGSDVGNAALVLCR